MSTTQKSAAVLTELTMEEHRRLTKCVLWKLDVHILPPLAFLWLTNYIDRTNIGNASIAGLQTDLHLQGKQFNTALAVFYITYILVELPSNWVLKKVQPNRWLPFIVGAWGIVTIFSGFMQNYGGLLAVRLMLGLCEGGLLPGMTLYLSTIYKRHELQLRVGIFYAFGPLSGAFGGLLASAIIHMSGMQRLSGWRWIFILEGIATVIIACVCAVFLPANIPGARFLTEEERRFALERIRMENVQPASVPVTEQPQNITEETENEGNIKIEDEVAKIQTIHQEGEEFEWREILRGLTDLQAWITGIAYLGLLVCLYSFSLFLPTIVAGLGYVGTEAQLHSVPPYVPAIALTVAVAFLADHFKWRGPFILMCLPLTIIGYIIAITVENANARYAAVFLIAAGVYPSTPCILTIMPNNTSGHYKKATTTALQLAIANAGGFVATFIYTDDQKPRYIRGHSIALAFVVLCWVLIASNVAYCLWENKARREGRRDANLDRYQELWDSKKTKAPIGDRHPNFRFTL